MEPDREVRDRVASLYVSLVAVVAVLGLAGLALGAESLARIVVWAVLFGPVAAVGTIAAVRQRDVLALFGAGTIVVVLVGIALAL